MNYYHPTHIYNYPNSLKELKEVVNNHIKNVKKVFLVLGSNHFKKSPFKKEVDEALSDFKVKEECLSMVEPNWAEIRRLITICEKFTPDIIIGIGGGSVLDAIKPVACLSFTGVDIADIMNRKKPITQRKIGLIAIPTTSGTGSEVTPFSVITNEDTNIKQSIGPKFYFPDIAIVDSRLNKTAPAKVKLDVGIDTMAHALEALWSKRNQYVSTPLAWQALFLALDNIENHIDDPDNESASFNMAKAANLAGIAFSNTFTAVCHGLSFPIGFKFGISHGESCSWTLPACIDKSINVLLDVKDTFVTKKKIYSLSSEIRHIRDKYYMQLNNNLPKLSDSDKNFIVENSFKPLLNNWVVNHNESDIYEILNKI